MSKEVKSVEYVKKMLQGDFKYVEKCQMEKGRKVCSFVKKEKTKYDTKAKHG